ncbi:hypothetical protein PMKS-001691 [Pichia membranifaciens]|uniref:Uncharacterized protein n=1 Tax=Pichia membranifaciens TaxID=4926 RepID=A0A1Q2YFG4_9ASCO|nr:hypothetical protein PMKS-001691 [Pichia membranifaciens]
MFPESDPSNLEHIKSIAKALFVKLPKYAPGELLGEIIENSCDGNDEYDENQEENGANFAEIGEEEQEGIVNQAQYDNPSEAQIGLGGADRLFNALLKVGKVDSANKLKFLESMVISGHQLPSSTMRNFSNNITILLRYFKLNGTPNTFDTISSTSLDSQVQALFREQEDISYLKAEDSQDCSSKNNVSLLPTEHDFFDFINFLNTGNDPESYFSDQLLLDWKKLFGTSGSSAKGHCDHQF